MTQKPKVHWVSPIPDAETDIAHYSHRILPELAETCDLTLWTDARRWDPALEDICPVRRLDPDRAIAQDFFRAGQSTGPDAIFVNIGNAWVFHAGLLRFLHRVPAIVVLHDLAIQEMCFDAMDAGRLARGTYEDAMLRWHGPDGLHAARDVFEGHASAGTLGQKYPGFEITLDRAVSVLTHTPAAFQAVRARGIAPAYQMDLPFRPSDTAPSPERALDGPLKFVQFGHIGPNRRLFEVLDALAPLRETVDFQLDIMGKVWDADQLQAKLTETGLSERVTVHGFVPEPELDQRLAEAHLVFNLRYPTMGEASGSQTRIWNACAAAVVTDLGWYGSLPEGTVFKIPLDGEADALRDLVCRLDADRTLGTTRGAAGRARLEARHTPALYAKGIAEIAHRFPKDAALSFRARRARAALAGLSEPGPLAEQALLARL